MKLLAFCRVSLDADIAILKLSTPFEFNDYVSGIGLGPETIEASGSCVNSGWGNILNNGSSQTPSILQKIELDIVSRTDCTARYAGIGIIFKGNLCAGTTNKGACNVSCGISIFNEKYVYILGVVD